MRGNMHAFGRSNDLEGMAFWALLIVNGSDYSAIFNILPQSDDVFIHSQLGSEAIILRIKGLRPKFALLPQFFSRSRCVSKWPNGV